MEQANFPSLGSHELPSFSTRLVIPTPVYSTNPNISPFSNSFPKFRTPRLPDPTAVPSFHLHDPTAEPSIHLPMMDETCSPTKEPIPSVMINHYPQPRFLGAVKWQPKPSTFYWNDMDQGHYTISHPSAYPDNARPRQHSLENPTTRPRQISLESTSTRPRRHSSYRTRQTSIEKPYTYPRTKYSATQLKILEERFQKCSLISREEREELAEQIDVPHPSLRTWFQNRRAKEKKKEEMQKQLARAASGNI